MHEGRAKSSKTIIVDSTFIRVKSTYHQLLSASECIADGGRAVRAWLNIERIMGHLSKVTCRFFPVRIILIHASLAWPLFWSTLSNSQQSCQKEYPTKHSFYLTCSDEDVGSEINQNLIFIVYFLFQFFFKFGLIFVKFNDSDCFILLKMLD